MKGKIKANTVDRYLRPIRLQVVELVKTNSTVLEFGCGNGDLLFKLSNKINSGVGIDNSKQLIAYATDRKEKEQFKKLAKYFKIEAFELPTLWLADQIYNLIQNKDYGLNALQYISKYASSDKNELNR